MIEEIVNFFCKKNKSEKVVDKFFRLSIQMDRENEEHVDHMNMFIDMLKDKKIEWTTFTPDSPTLFSNRHNPRRTPFFVAVDLKYKNDVLEIHKTIYGF